MRHLDVVIAEIIEPMRFSPSSLLPPHVDKALVISLGLNDTDTVACRATIHSDGTIPPISKTIVPVPAADDFVTNAGWREGNKGDRKTNDGHAVINPQKKATEGGVDLFALDSVREGHFVRLDVGALDQV
jgi:hypothetical protein